MTDLDYLDRAERLLQAVEAGCDRIADAADTDIDIDAQRTGGMLTLSFGDTGGQIVVNLQPPLQEVWLAAKSGGYHYRFNGREWRDERGGGEFFADLSRDASRQVGRALVFSASNT